MRPSALVPSTTAVTDTYTHRAPLLKILSRAPKNHPLSTLVVQSYNPHLPVYHMSNLNTLPSIVNSICLRLLSTSTPRFCRTKRKWYLEILFSTICVYRCIHSFKSYNDFHYVNILYSCVIL